MVLKLVDGEIEGRYHPSTVAWSYKGEHVLKGHRYEGIVAIGVPSVIVRVAMDLCKDPQTNGACPPGSLAERLRRNKHAKGTVLRCRHDYDFESRFP